jgi:hypothetical protein
MKPFSDALATSLRRRCGDPALQSISGLASTDPPSASLLKMGLSISDQRP